CVGSPVRSDSRSGSRCARKSARWRAYAAPRAGRSRDRRGRARALPRTQTATKAAALYTRILKSEAGKTVPTHGPASLYAPDQRLQKEVGDPLGRRRTLVHLLQILPPPQIAQDHTRDGRWRQRSHLERARTAGGRLIGGFPLWPRPPSTHKA